MRRVLIIAYYFPPIGGIGSIRLARYAELLPEFGWEPVVVAPARTPHAEDPALAIPANVRRAQSIELSRAGRALRPASGEGRAAAPSLKQRLRAAVYRRVYPDPQIGWYPGAVRAGRALLREQRFDAIFSSSYPVTAHLVARRLSRRAALPWVAEFRDPSGFVLPADNVHRERAAALDAKLARDAARVVMPTPGWAAHFGAEWDCDIAVIPNGTDAMPAPSPPSGVTVVTHLGSYYPARQSLTEVWRAARELASEREVVLRFIGELGTDARSELAAAGVTGLVEETGFVPHQRAVELVASSSILVAAGPHSGDPVTRGWVPAKLFEYLASGLPVLYVGDSGTDAAALVGDHDGCFVVTPGDRAGLERAFAAAGMAFPRDQATFGRRNRTEALAALLHDATGKT